MQWNYLFANLYGQLPDYCFHVFIAQIHEAGGNCIHLVTLKVRNPLKLCENT